MDPRALLACLAEVALPAWKHPPDVQVRALLAAGADPRAVTDPGWTPLHVAAYGGHGDVAEQLLAAGAEPRAAIARGGWTALHMAAQHGSAGVVWELVQVMLHSSSAANYCSPRPTTTTGLGC